MSPSLLAPPFLRLSDPPCLNLTGDATVGRGAHLSPDHTASHRFYLTSLACTLKFGAPDFPNAAPLAAHNNEHFPAWSDLLAGGGSSFGVLRCDWWMDFQPPSECTTAAEEHLVLSDATSEMENQAPQSFVQSFV